MVPDTTNRLNKAAEELRELVVSTPRTLDAGAILTGLEIPVCDARANTSLR